ncbi:Uncharacterised protein [Campylobacter hyointestinalis]|nr:Uncharacterised protein [Campylobacter hyointestinalis]
MVALNQTMPSTTIRDSAPSIKIDDFLILGNSTLQAKTIISEMKSIVMIIKFCDESVCPMDFLKSNAT